MRKEVDYLPAMFKAKPGDTQNHMCHYSSYGPVFGVDMISLCLMDVTPRPAATLTAMIPTAFKAETAIHISVDRGEQLNGQ